MPLDMLFDFLAMHVNGPKAAGKKVNLNWVFSDTKEKYLLSLENSVLNHTAGVQRDDADATLTLSREILNRIVLGQTTLEKMRKTGDVKLAGNELALDTLLSTLDTFEFWFNIVTP